MRRVRRMSSDVHVELTPMIDVVFLLLTFFLFSIVLMVRADVLDVNLPELGSGRTASETIPITVTITELGDVLVNKEPVGIDGVVEAVRGIREASGAGPVVLAVDTAAPAGVMISIADELTGAGMGEFSIIGHKRDASNVEDAGAGIDGSSDGAGDGANED